MIDEEQLHDFIIIFIGRSHGRWIESKQKMKNEENTHTQQSSNAYLLHQCCKKLHGGKNIETPLRSGYRYGIDQMLWYVVQGGMQICKTDILAMDLCVFGGENLFKKYFSK